MSNKCIISTNVSRDNEKWLTPEKESSIKKMVADAFYPGQAQEGDVEAELKHVIMNINTCIKKENLLTVYKVGKSGTQELDAAILHSLLQGIDRFFDTYD